ncbi:DUF2934 family protein [Ancylobacter aquaticus]|uniref:DUF2934 family protein n=1 Tax=Ancylobacter aquaticus TaxID=100 RepID=A0A4R1II73_ANCAQ|nr:DUF2934 domain-containing protein [Ancylobacter aquaticus]TCK31412.1 DUF2934 family protein [Ancylobacter aquaticus]
MNERETRIREWAYRLWEEQGYPHGRDEEHWLRAVAIVMEEDGVAEAGPAAEPTPEPMPEPAAAPAPSPVPAAKPKAARAKTAGAEPTVTQAPAPAPATPGRRKR